MFFLCCIASYAVAGGRHGRERAIEYLAKRAYISAQSVFRLLCFGYCNVFRTFPNA
jgi:hypothetical protein